MQKHLKFIDGTSDKFWQIEASGLQFTVTYGKNGTSGVSQTKVFDSAEECLKTAEKLLAEKVKKGYSESGEVTVPQNAASASSSSKAKTQPKSELKEVLDMYDDIIKNRKSNELLPFLQEKSKGNMEGLKAHIKKAKRFWMTYMDISKEPEYKKNGYNGWGQRADETQQRMITLSAIALFDKADINSWSEAFRMFEETHKDDFMAVLAWAKPNWVDTFLLETIKKQEWFSLTYLSLRALESNGLIEYNPELFAVCLGRYNEWQHTNNEKLKASEYFKYLTTDEITLKRDIPELFNYETILHTTSYTPSGKNSARNLWEDVFAKLIADGKMEKSYFVENALLIQTKEWNNNVKSFFRKRIEDLALSAQEMVVFQETIFSFLNAAYPPIVSYGFELCKAMYDQPNFDTHSFLEWTAPVMMRADCKAGFKILMPILDKIAKEAPQYSGTIAALLADIFLIADLSLQEKAAKSLLKIGDKNDADLIEKLVQYAPQMQGNIKSLLSNLLEGNDLMLDTGGYTPYVFAPQKPLLLTQKVVLPQDWNDVLFQFGKFISSDDVIEGEILLNTFITQRHLFPSDYVEQLKPYFKQLESKYFEETYKDFIKAFLMGKMIDMNKTISPSYDQYIQSKTLKTGIKIIQIAEGKVGKKSTLPLLSFPTHTPHWVNPKTLIERIIAHQEAGEGVDMVDLTIAINRMPRENVADALPLLAQLDAEMQKLIGYCLGQHDSIDFTENSMLSKLILLVGGSTKKTENTALWAVAARTHNPEKSFTAFEKTYLADVPFVVSPYRPHIFMKESWSEWKDYHTKKLVRSPSWYELRYEKSPFKDIPENLFYALDIYEKSTNAWYNHLHNAANVAFCHSLMPQNSESLAFTMIDTVLRTTNNSSNELKGYMNIVNSPEFSFSDPTAIAFGACFFQEKKDIRFLATEVLINVIENKALNTALMGEKLAFLVSNNYGVLLRAIESIIAIKDVTPTHNSALLQILDAFFKNIKLEDKLPTNFKKLVESYMDLLIKTQQKPAAEALSFFEKWADNTSLKSLVKQIKSI